MNVGSLFAGVGGFDLGFERAGMHTDWFVEKDSYCQAVLRKHWPGVPIFDDVCNVGAHNLPRVDVLCGGFPCQDISSAGKGAGLAGSRSGLWFEFERLTGELRPSYVVVENVPLLRTRGLDVVITGLASLGYDAEWDVISAADVGAPHLRKRIWIVAYPQREQLREQSGRRGWPSRASEALTGLDGEARPVADAQGVGQREPHDQAPAVAWQESREGAGWRSERGGGFGGSAAWAVEPDVGRVAHGVPARMDRLRALGNALVPQIAEEIGRRILSYETHPRP